MSVLGWVVIGIIVFGLIVILLASWYYTRRQPPPAPTEEEEYEIELAARELRVELRRIKPEDFEEEA